MDFFFLLSLDIRDTICLEWFTVQLLSDNHMLFVNPHHRHVRYSQTCSYELSERCHGKY